MPVTYITRPEQLEKYTCRKLDDIREVSRRYAFRTNSYYAGLVDWDNQRDPLRRIVIPDKRELQEWGRLDASDEKKYTVVPGCEHKYRDTALLLVTNVCGGYCRFCFRKRLFMNDNAEIARDVKPGLEYIAAHRELTNILLTGGDPLILSTPRLAKIIGALHKIAHVRIIRIGSKIPAFNPLRILEDPELCALFERHSRGEKRIYLMAHFNHPRELTPLAIEAIGRLQRAGVVCANQTPLLAGINSNPAVLGELFRKLSFAGLPPYYVFIGRPTAGNRCFAVPIEKSFDIFERARMRCSGLAKRARLVMSHATGKIEIAGMTADQVYFRYHRGAHQRRIARFMACRRNPDAFWYDDYDEISSSYSPARPYRCFGPD